MFSNKGGFKKEQKVYVPGRAEYGRVKMFRGGLIKVLTFKSRQEIWVKPHEIENGE
ncbi:hypothetical protein SEA_MOAB_142 [Streptomyces phage Moab]|nr:hypothetical protein SEA_MOAB_142 [Streptomyces phage Moab]WMI33758.1 hypothetical protein SEA_PATELGO_145 [Streptomyces phage Patelgo]